MSNDTASLLAPCKPGLIIVLSAPAGTGKTTLVQMLTEEFDEVTESVSCTTRSPRPGEVSGDHYHFLSDAEFNERVATRDFLENVELFGKRYGTSRHQLQEQQDLGKHVVLTIDTVGAMKVREKLDCISLFVSPPSLEILRERLIKRQTETEESLTERLRVAEEEMKLMNRYDYCVVNDKLHTAYQVLRSIVVAETHKVDRAQIK
jgi:guanylate kinase